MHDIGSLCISTMCLFNFFLVGITSEQEKQRKETKGKGARGRSMSITRKVSQLLEGIESSVEGQNLVEKFQSTGENNE